MATSTSLGCTADTKDETTYTMIEPREEAGGGARVRGSCGTSKMFLLVLLGAAAMSLGRAVQVRLPPSSRGAPADTTVFSEPGQLFAQRRPRPLPLATVVAEPGQAPAVNETAAELLRFVTAYRAGLEALVDITPYSPLLASAVDADGEIHFYAFIDTWVGNGSGTDMVYINNVTGQCVAERHSYGNGWSLTLDLVLWPERGAVDIRPKKSVTLATGYFGGRFPLGVVDVHEGHILDGQVVELSAPADLSAAAAPPQIYACPGGPEEAMRAALLGFAAQQADRIERKPGSPEERDAAKQELEDELVEMLVTPHLQEVKVITTFDHNRSVLAGYNASLMNASAGMPVFFQNADVYTDQEMYEGLWWNLTYPFKPIGRVLNVSDETLMLQLDGPCLPSAATKSLPKLLIPAGPSVLSEAKSLIGSAVWHGHLSATLAALHRRRQDDELVEPLLLEPSGGWSRWESATELHAQLPDRGSALERLLGPPIVLGRASLQVETGGASVQALQLQQRSPSNEASSSRACVVVQRRQGHLFARQFELPSACDGDRVVLQLSVTGHGWSMTTDQCGEYCHVVYRLILNGQSIGNVTQFRDDCDSNPINGSVQHGTWWESRNGWCPGSVEPGFFLDVSKWSSSGQNKLEFDVVVWSNHTQRYEAYTDFSGFALGDQASLTVGFSLFTYGSESVKAILQQEHAYTAAEAALRDGSSSPQSLAGPLVVEDEMSGRGGLEAASRVAKLREEARNVRYDFEARAPWYLFNETVEGSPGVEAGAARIRIFDSALVQGATRTVTASISRSAFSERWGQAALQLRLSRPDGLEFDHWDRQASVGLLLRQGGQDARVIVAEPPIGHRRWKLAASEDASAAIPTVDAALA